VLSRRREWLSITPEPERELPRAIATLKAGGRPSEEAVEHERERAERLVLHGTRRRWRAWLREAERLAGRVDPERGAGELAAAREHALAVIDNHDALMLGLSGRAAAATAPERRVRPGPPQEDHR
jgi:hypothetical protein